MFNVVFHRAHLNCYYRFLVNVYIEWHASREGERESEPRHSVRCEQICWGEHANQCRFTMPFCFVPLFFVSSFWACVSFHSRLVFWLYDFSSLVAGSQIHKELSLAVFFFLFFFSLSLNSFSVECRLAHYDGSVCCSVPLNCIATTTPVHDLLLFVQLAHNALTLFHLHRFNSIIVSISVYMRERTATAVPTRLMILRAGNLHKFYYCNPFPHIYLHW